MGATAISRNYRRSLRGWAALTGAATLTVMTAAGAAASPVAQAATRHSHRAIAPGAISYDSALEGVSADSPKDAWAGGDYVNSSGRDVPLILHWNGQEWTKAKIGVPRGSTYASLNGMSAVSATDTWTVGSYFNSSGTRDPLVMHWNGTAWTREKSPAPSGATGTDLQGVSAVSATDAWVAGWYDNSSGTGEPLALHWDGTAWTRVNTPVPSGADYTYLYGVSAVSATDAWAVGYYYSGGVGLPLILHWNGKTWKRMKSPVASGATYTTLYGVSAVSATNAWADGSYTNSSGVQEPLIMHCNGNGCSEVKSPGPSGAESIYLNQMSVISATNAWVAGSYTNSSGVTKPLILQCSSATCKQLTSPLPGKATTGGLSGVSAASATAAWAVGQYEINATIETLTLHWNGKVWTPVKSPNGV